MFDRCCRKHANKSAAEAILYSKLFKDDPVRYLALSYVKAGVIGQFARLSVCDRENT